MGKLQVRQVTKRVSILSGGYAKAVLVRFGKKAVIIDPGQTGTKEEPGFLQRVYFKPTELLFGKVLANLDVTLPTLVEFLKDRENRLTLIRNLLDPSLYPDPLTGEDEHALYMKRVFQLRELLEAEGLELVAILSTHHHIDHLGCGMQLSSEVDNVPIYVPSPMFFDSEILRDGTHPFQHPTGENPYLDYSGFDLDGIEVINISGHTSMVGILVDGCFVVGDLLISENAWRKSGALYLEDAKEHLNSLRKAREIGFTNLIPGHGKTDSFDHTPGTALIDLNLREVSRMIELVRDARDVVELTEELTRDLPIPIMLKQMLSIPFYLRGY